MIRRIAVLALISVSLQAQTPKPVSLGSANASVSQAQKKELQDAMTQLRQAALSVQTAQQHFVETNAVAKQALEVLNQSIAGSPEVKQAMQEQAAKHTAVLAKIDALRKQQGLDASWEWDFGREVFVQVAKTAATK